MSTSEKWIKKFRFWERFWESKYDYPLPPYSPHQNQRGTLQKCISYNMMIWTQQKQKEEPKLYMNWTKEERALCIVTIVPLLTIGILPALNSSKSHYWRYTLQYLPLFFLASYWCNHASWVSRLKVKTLGPGLVTGMVV